MKKSKTPSIETLRHSLAHILAYAVKELFGEVKFGTGPATDVGFYYDFEFPKSVKITPEVLPKIEKKMKQLIKQNIKFEKKLISKKKATELFKNQPFKLDLIKKHSQKEPLSIYQSGDFIDLCKGPHVKSTKEIPIDGFKLTKIAGAYWQGDEKNPMLTRIYGVAFKTKKELKNYIETLQQIQKRDHRKLGASLDLFHIDEEFGAGLPLWHPKGAILRQIIQDFELKQHIAQGYQLIFTPHIAHLSLWKKTGHWNFYRENMYPPMKLEGEDYILKPMNCPGHILIYKSKTRSYKELPLRYFELGTVYRYERSGTLHGLTRVRGFTQDDAHIWVTPEKLTEELIRILKFGLKMLRIFGFKKYNIYLSTRPEKYVGSLKNWKKAENSLKFALKTLNLKYQIDPGEGVFYGPKIDIKIEDSLGREWQCTTVQVDFNLPERLDVFYIDKKGKKQRPIMIHRALVGSIERFTGVLLEHYGGALPLWLSPEQLWIIPVGSSHKTYAQKIGKEFQKEEIRVKVKDENETVSRKIREGEIQKIPYLAVIGDKEMKNQSLRVRKRGNKDLGEIKIKDFLSQLKKEIEKFK